MLRVTADTNIFISGLNFAGIPRQILNLAQSGAIRLAVSDEILDEVTRVLRREKSGPAGYKMMGDAFPLSLFR